VAESASRSPYTLTAWDSVEDFREASTINSLSQPFTDTWTYYAGTPTNLYYLSHEESHPRDGVVISGTSIEEMASLLLVAQHIIFGRHIRSFVPPPPPPSLSFLSSPSQRTFRTLCALPDNTGHIVIEGFVKRRTTDRWNDNHHPVYHLEIIPLSLIHQNAELRLSGVFMGKKELHHWVVLGSQGSAFGDHYQAKHLLLQTKYGVRRWIELLVDSPYLATDVVTILLPVSDLWTMVIADVKEWVELEIEEGNATAIDRLQQYEMDHPYVRAIMGCYISYIHARRQQNIGEGHL